MLKKEEDKFHKKKLRLITTVVISMLNLDIITIYAVVRNFTLFGLDEEIRENRLPLVQVCLELGQRL